MSKRGHLFWCFNKHNVLPFSNNIRKLIDNLTLQCVASFVERKNRLMRKVLCHEFGVLPFATFYHHEMIKIMYLYYSSLTKISVDENTFFIVFVLYDSYDFNNLKDKNS